MIRQLLKYKWYIAIIMVLIIVEPLMNSILNFWLQRLFNNAIPGEEKFYMLRLLTIGFLLWMLKRIAVFSSAVLKTRFICNAKQDIKHKLFSNLIGLDTSNVLNEAKINSFMMIV